MSKIIKDLSHYLPLLGVLGFGFLGFFLFSYDRGFQIVVIIATAFGYLTWGLIHHSLHKDLTAGVVWEYLAFAFLGLVLALSILFNS